MAVLMKHKSRDEIFSDIGDIILLRLPQMNAFNNAEVSVRKKKKKCSQAEYVPPNTQLVNYPPPSTPNIDTYIHGF